MTNKEFSRLFRRIVAESGLSYNELSRRSGTGSSTLTQWANAKTSPRIEVLDVVLKELGYRIEVHKC